MDKAGLRKNLKLQRHQLTHQEVQAKSQAIAKYFFAATDLSTVNSVHVYLPIKQEQEIDTWPILRKMWQDWPRVKTAAPRLNDRQLEAVEINPQTPLLANSFRIPEPAIDKTLPPGYQFDVIIVPLLGFDERGHRLGYGGGYYDKFLAMQKTALTVGLCYEQGYITSLLPYESHDIALQLVITEARIFRF